MSVRYYFTAAVIAGALFALPIQGQAEDRAPGPIGSTADIQVASTSYCYAGSSVDPATGETVDHYNLCEDSLDMA
ncbi:MAG TPA: hypothetical protein VIB79_07810 [Candidatus Binatia bacterium]|jgi:hypothetical protein